MKRPRTKVTDHAVLRYLERVGGFEIERLREEIGRRIDDGAAAGAGTVVIEGWAYVLGTDPTTGEPVVVTVMRHQPDHPRLMTRSAAMTRTRG